MQKLLFIGLGGAIGSILRYVISGIDYRVSGGVFPVSTFVVNLSGSLVIGFLWGIFEAVAISPQVRMFIFVGVLGGFTTFSTFALENFNLIRDGERGIAYLNIILSNVIGVGLVFVGYGIAKAVLNLSK
ncbi:MAG: fluoride efflux transporter CrcB [Candidatus Omnitrophota bacterium]